MPEFENGYTGGESGVRITVAANQKSGLEGSVVWLLQLGKADCSNIEVFLEGTEMSVQSAIIAL